MEELLSGVAEYFVVILVGPISKLNCLYLKSILALRYGFLVTVPFVFLGQVWKANVRL